MKYSDTNGGLIKRYTKDGKGSWVACIRYKDDSGKWRTKYKTTAVRCYPDSDKGQAAAGRAARAFRRELEEEQRKREESPGADTPVCEFIDRYIDTREKDRTIERSTISGYRSGAKYLRRYLAGVTLGQLDPDRVERLKLDMLSDGRSEYTTKKTCNLLSRICKYAVTQKAIASNPCVGVKRPKTYRRKPNALDRDGIARLNAALESLGYDAKTDMVRAALLTGMRRGELCGLRWIDVDEEAQTITVRNVLGMDNGAPYEKRPKNDGSERIIDYGANMAAILQRRKAEQGAACMALGVESGGRLYVFGEAASQEQAPGSWISPDIISKFFTKKVAMRANLIGTQGIRPVFHDLRHTFATHAIASGMDIESVSKILGHKNASMTLDIYADALPDNKRAVMHRMDAILSESTGAPRVLELPGTGTDGR